MDDALGRFGRHLQRAFPMHDAIVDKGWSKGLTAGTDGRVARAAAAHRGMRYAVRSRAHVPMGWTARLAYAVGLIATDGCRSPDGRHVAFGSRDRDLVETLLGCLDKTHLRIAEQRTRKGGLYFRVQIGDVALYRWLESIGLTQRKSLTLGRLLIPAACFLDFTRGLLDGDGTIYTLQHRPTVRAALITCMNGSGPSSRPPARVIWTG
ncbi:MAG: hypothetical protein FJ034_04595 [Chloroflexi bacterium]|nr:hypothetical protein [Chloroflexota bacterium]